MTARDSLTLSGQQADWLKLLLLRCAEAPDQDVLSLWVFAVTTSSKLSRVNKLQADIKARFRQELPGLGLLFKCTKRNRRLESGDHLVQVSSFRVTWNPDVQISGPISDAIDGAQRAKALMAKRQYAPALHEAVAAVRACDLYFPPYSLCIQALTHLRGMAEPSTAAGTSADGDLRTQGLPQQVLPAGLTSDDVSRVLIGVAAIEHWYDQLARGLGSDHVPEEYNGAINALCIRDISFRKSKLARLRAMLDGDGLASPVVANPVNPILDVYRDFLASDGTVSSLEPDEILDLVGFALYDEIQSETIAAIKRSQRFISTERQQGWDAALGFTEENNLRAALASLISADHDFRFPEPFQTTKWRESTVITWMKAALYPRSDHQRNHGEVDYEKVKHSLSSRDTNANRGA